MRSMDARPESCTKRRLRLTCAVGTLPALRAAVGNGAEWVSFRLKHRSASAAAETHRPYPIFFSEVEAAAGIRYAHAHRARVLLTIDTFPIPEAAEGWQRAIDAGADLGVDAIALGDTGLMRHAARAYPSLPLHLAVTASATSHHAIDFYYEHFGIERALVPRTLTLAEVERIALRTPVQIEVHAFGGACSVFEGHCGLSSYATGVSRTTCGVCTPPAAVRWHDTHDHLESRVNGVLVDRYRENEHARYPIPCGGRYEVAGRTYFTFGEPVAVNAIEQLPALMRSGVAAVRLEGLRGYLPHLAEATRSWRSAIDLAYDDPARFDFASDLALVLRRLTSQPPDAPGALHRARS